MANLLHKFANCFNKFENLLICFLNYISKALRYIFGYLDITLLRDERLAKTVKVFIITGLILGVLSMIIYAVTNTILDFTTLISVFSNFSAFYNLFLLIVVAGAIGIGLALIFFTLFFLLVKITSDNQSNIFIIAFALILIYSIIVSISGIELNPYFVISLSLSSYLASAIDLIRDTYSKDSLFYKLRNIPLYIILMLSAYLLVKNPESFFVGYFDFSYIDINALSLGSVGLIFASIGIRRMKS